MNGKTVAGIVLILAVVNLFALMWFVVLANHPYSVSLFAFIIFIVIAFSASAFSEKKK